MIRVVEMQNWRHDRRFNVMVSLARSPVGYACWAVSFLLQESIMATITLFGLDIGKHSSHLAEQDANGKPVFKHQFTRSRLCSQNAGFLSTNSSLK